MREDKKKRVVYLGPKYTFSHEAALKMFPKAEHFYQLSPRKVFEMVESGEVDYGVLPVENSATGVISDTFHLLLDQDFERFSASVRVQIVNELILPIYHNILSKTDIPLSQAKRIYTHRQAHLQCTDWIERHMPWATVEDTSSTSAAAEKLSQDTRGICIGGNLLAKEEGLIKLRENIQDYKRNVTRFLGISAKHKKLKRNHNKTTFAIIIPDTPGMLVRALSLISSEDINLLGIKTLPIRAFKVFNKDFKDWFIIDLPVSSANTAFQKLLEQFKERTDTILSCKILGSYKGGDGLTGKGSGKKEKEPLPENDKLYLELIAEGESESVEFKSSMRYDLNTKTVNKELSNVVGKTICGFLNIQGGYLFIGVRDNGEASGIELDISTIKKKDEDGYLALLYQIVTEKIGAEYCQYVHPRIIKYNKKKICCVKIDASPKAAWFNENEFYIRSGNGTRLLTSKTAMSYIMSRFNLR